jgi:hypothetical protein
MASIVNADNGSVSGSAGLKSTADSSGVLQLQTNGTAAVTVDTSQNVGIGTASPAAKLQIDSSSATYSANIRARNSNFGNGVVGAASNILTVATDMNNMAFYTGSNLGVDGTSVPTNERMRIDSSGNVGIGTASPATKLHVVGAVNATTFLNLGGNTSAPVADAAIYRPADGTLGFVSNAAERMRIDSNGNVLVNTTTAQTGAKLSVTGGISGVITSGTMVASTSGTSIDFTSIPSWVKKITIMYSGVSTNGNSQYLVQIGTSGGITSTGYTSAAWGNGNTIVTSTVGFLLTNAANAVYLNDGAVVIYLVDAATYRWVSTGTLSGSAGGVLYMSSGAKTLTAALDRVRITSVTPDTFDAGNINIQYEG